MPDGLFTTAACMVITLLARSAKVPASPTKGPDSTELVSGCGCGVDQRLTRLFSVHFDSAIVPAMERWQRPLRHERARTFR
jgi:hypothetical protein